MYKIFREKEAYKFPANYAPNLFLSQQHRELQSSAWQSWYLVNCENAIIQAEIHLSLQKNTFINPVRAPFSSWYFHPELPAELSFGFLKDVFDEIDGEISLTMPPSGYFSDQTELIRTFLKSCGFLPKVYNPHWLLEISGEEFDAQFRSADARRRLKNTWNEGFRFRMEEPGSGEEIYEFIEEHQVKKAFRMSMNREEFRRHLNQVGEEMVFSTLRKKNNIAAAFIGFRVYPDIIYDFMHSHDSNWSAFSPVIALINGLYQWSQLNGIRVLDLGACSLEGKINLPLVRFKESLGAQMSEKLTWIRPEK